MNSLVRVFSNFKEFYNEINGATLTGAIDVIVVEQPDGEFLCSPFHVRFGKLGVLRSREKVVDIEINGEPVDIHMKLGDSGEAFFVEECPEEEIEELPENLATSPIPTNEFHKYEERKNYTSANDELPLPLPLPRRNSIDFSKDLDDDNKENKFENQISDYTHRRHTDNILSRRNLETSKIEYTTQKIRQEWAVHEETLLQFDVKKNDEWINNIEPATTKIDVNAKNQNNDEIIDKEQQLKQDKSNQKATNDLVEITATYANNTIKLTDDTKAKDDNINVTNNVNSNNNNNKNEDSKSKKRRRKKSQIKKKNSQNAQAQQQQQRKSSSSSSIGSIQIENNEPEPDIIELSNNTTGSSNDESSSKIDENSSNSENKTIIESSIKFNLKNNDNKDKEQQQQQDKNLSQNQSTPNRLRDLDIHFFSDTEVASVGLSPHCSRPSTPIQSDSELELSQREKDEDGNLMTNSASWKWGELPQTDEQKDVPQVQQRNSMLSGMFSFMKKTNKMRKNATSTEGVYLSDLDTDCMDPEMAALYFPPINKDTSLNILPEEDRESGNGTSLPHSPSSMEGGLKSLDSDYDDSRTEKYLDFVAISLCGGMDKDNGPTDEDFDRHMIKYSDVCKNPGIFSSSNLVVRLNGKYYSWTAACPIVMTIITFQKPLSDDAIEHLMNVSKSSSSGIVTEDDISASSMKSGIINSSISSENSAQETKQRGYSWWYWRRSGRDKHDTKDADGKEIDQTAVATQTSRANSPDHPINSNQNNLINESSTSSSDIIRSFDGRSLDTSDSSVDKTSEYRIENNGNSKEKYRKSLRLSSKSIKGLNLKPGMNEIEFSVTTAYQGTSRCKCYLFRWKYNDKVVISDIDGTITKSDVLGHILPMVGKDWAQIGVAQLFSKIEANGYKLLYLSARAIGQSRVTREYLRSIRQGDVKLPDGPLLLNPTSLISAFHREVIEKKPEQFKIACLSDIQALFPENPFYAGYGNRINDVWAYRAVGIPIMRIFTINTKGELKHELTQTFQSSYCSMTYIVDQLFPPIKDDEGTIEYSHFNYWRDPLPDIEINDIDIIPNSLTTNTSATTTNGINTNTTVNATATTNTVAINTATCNVGIITSNIDTSIAPIGTVNATATITVIDTANNINSNNNNGGGNGGVIGNINNNAGTSNTSINVNLSSATNQTSSSASSSSSSSKTLATIPEN